MLLRPGWPLSVNRHQRVLIAGEANSVAVEMLSSRALLWVIR